MKRLLTLYCMMLSISMTMTLLAVPAKPGIHTVKQSDGTTLSIELHGDEHFHFTTTDDGYLIRQNADGVYEYAELTAERIVKPIGVKAYSTDQRVTADQQLPNRAVKAVEAFCKYQSIRDKNLKIKDIAPRKKAEASAKTLASHGLVLLVQYKDVKFDSASTQSSMNEMLNGANYDYDGATGSVRKYFSDQSNGLYVPDFDVVGPITVSRNMAYYGQNDSSGDDLHAAELINEACSIANARFGVDFSQYDSDGDDNVDFVYVIYAGYAEAQGADENTIWPHKWDLYSAGIPDSQRQYDGKYVWRYACSAELRGYSESTRDGIGTFCHEFSHVLGLPDYYDTNDEKGVDNTSKEPGVWSLMSNGGYNNDGKTPPNYSAYDKYYLGWITPTVLNPAGEVTLEAETYYAITADGTLSAATDAKDVWYLEHRQQIGWDASLPAHGMLITKVHYDESAWKHNEVNNGTTLYYDIVEADGLSPKYKTAGITFPGAKNVRSVNLVDSCTLTNITEYITETSSIIRFDFTKEFVDDEPTDNSVFYDTFETNEAWLITDNSTTVSFNMKVGRITNVAAVYGTRYLISGYDPSAARDAWAIMRDGVLLKADQEYTLSAYVRARGSRVADQVQFTVGTSSYISSQTQVVLDIHEKYDSWTLVTAKFTPTIDGKYYFGIHHCTQETNVNIIAIDDFSITPSVTKPDSPEDSPLLFYDGFEGSSIWLTNDSSTTSTYASYGGVFVSALSTVPAAKGDHYLISSSDSYDTRDAWAVSTIAVPLKAGQAYMLSAYVWAPGNGDVADQIQFTMGTSSSISKQTKVILEVHERYESWTLVTAKFKPASDGLYHFGIHHCTQALDVNAIAVDEFMIMESVDDKIPVTGISLDLAELELFVGKTYQLTATITPDNATNTNLLWSSSHEDVAMVENGLIVARSKGRAIVTATTEDGNYTASCIVVVVDDTALEDCQITDEKNGVWKVFEDGTIYVIRDTEKYTIDGRKVK